MPTTAAAVAVTDNTASSQITNVSNVTMYVRMEGLPPFALSVSNKLLPDHLETVARSYSREQLGVKTNGISRYVLVRRCVFSNKDQLLDFKLLQPPPKSSASAPSGASVAATAGNAALGVDATAETYYNRHVQSQAGSRSASIKAGNGGGAVSSGEVRSPSTRSVSRQPSEGDLSALQNEGLEGERFVGKSFAFVNVAPAYCNPSPSVEDVRKQFQVTDPGSTVVLSPYVHQISVISLHRLVLLATDPYTDTLLGDVLLLTYRQYATVNEVLERVLERFDVPPLVQPGSPERSPLDTQFYTELQRRIQLRVFSVLEQWVEHYGADFSDPSTFTRLRKWAVTKVDKAGAPARLLHLLDTVDRRPLHTRKPLLLPGVPRRGVTPTSVLVRYSPAEIAAQLTILTQCVHGRLTPAELVGRRWETDEAALIPNFIAYRDFFARVGNWSTYAVVSECDSERRAINLERLLVVCDELIKLRNWDMLVAVYGGLTDGAVVRLHRTWRALRADAAALSGKLQELLASSGSYRTLKDVMLTSERPHFPCIATFFKELRTLEDEPVSRQGQVNYLRCLKQYQLITELLAGKEAIMEEEPEPISELLGSFSFWCEVDSKTLMSASLELET